MTSPRPPAAAERQAGEAVGFGGPGTRRLKLLRWRPIPNPMGPVIGHLDVETASGLQIIDIRFGAARRGAPYIMMPTEKTRDRDDRVLLDDRGKPRCPTFVDFRNKDVRQRFSDEVLVALRGDHAELFCQRGPAMIAPPINCANLHRDLKGGPVVGGVTLRIPAWHLTVFGVVWLNDAHGQHIVLPRREWVEPAGGRRVADIFMFDDYAAQGHFELTALPAAKRLLNASAR